METFEEAGVQGTVCRVALGRYRHGRGRRAAVVEVYLLHVDGEAECWPERDMRTRRWVPAAAASAQVGVAGLRPVLRRAAEAIKTLEPV